MKILEGKGIYISSQSDPWKYFIYIEIGVIDLLNLLRALCDEDLATLSSYDLAAAFGFLLPIKSSF